MMRTLLWLALYISACNPSRNAAVRDFVVEGYIPAEIFEPEGMAGCGFLLKSDSLIFQPLNLADSLKIRNRKVWVKFHQEKHQMSVCMMGPVVTIDAIEKRE